MRPLILLIAVLAVAPATASAQDPATSGSFAELAGEAGCMVQAGVLTDELYVSGEDSLKGCDKGRGLIFSQAVAVSPDDRNVYVVAGGSRTYGSSAVVTFARAADTGRLSFTECVSDNGGDGRLGSDGLCGNGDALLGAADVVVSPDGRFVYVPSAGSNGVAWFARDAASGRLTQAGCVKEVPREDHCSQATALIGASSATASPDGRFLYVTSRISDAVAIFERDAETGALTQAGCVSNTGSDGRCTDGTALTGASSVVISPDGTSAYVTADEVGAVSWYARDVETGLLTPKGCLVEVAVEGGPCTSNKALKNAADAVITPGGDQVVVAGRYYGTLVTFARDAATGALTQSGCRQAQEPRGDEVIPDEEDEEFEEELDDEEEEFDAEAEEEDFEADEEEEEDEDALLEGCTAARAIQGASELALSADGKALFVTGGSQIAAFQRDPANGALTQFACTQAYRTYKSCTDTRGVAYGSGLAASSDGRSLYVVDSSTGAVSTFGAATAVTARVAKVARDGTAAVRLACPAARQGPCRGRIAVAAKRRHALGNRFLIAPGRAARVRVTVPRRVRRALGHRRSARVMLVLRDARRATRLGGRRITLKR